MMKRISLELVFLISLLLIEAIFQLNMSDSFVLGNNIRILVFSIVFVVLLSLILHKAKDKTKRIVFLVCVIVFSLFALIEMEFVNFIGHYYSFNAVGDGFGVMVFIPQFVKLIKAEYWLVLFLPISFYVIFAFVFKVTSIKMMIIYKVIIFTAFVLIFVISLNYETDAFYSAISNHDNYEVVIQKIGINAFLFEDLGSSFLPQKEKKEDLTIEEVEEIEPVEDVVEEIVEIDYERKFDDSKFIEVMEKETDETYKAIDSYVLSRPIERKNDKTGIYEGYNFVYFMVESLDYIAIDKVLTPTLYKMHSEGYSFLNHYTPIYVCGTGDSEWVGMTGTFPTMNQCVAYNKTVSSRQSLAGLFSNQGYSCYSFHNWDDQFYPRTSLEPNYGFDAYYDQTDLKLQLVNGWLSDRELVEKALPYFINDDHFFAFIITSTMHFPYDGSSYYGDKYLEEVNKVHPNYPIEIKRFLSKSIEFDKSLELLLEELEKAGKLEKTVISIYGDHHPKTIAGNILIECCEALQKEGTYATDLLPFIIYCPSQKGEFNYEYCCNVDQLPTIANMFNLNYDPRLYCGSDIFSGNSAAIFPNGDWKTNRGQYHASSDTFEDYTAAKASEYYWKNKNADIKNMRKINQAMINSDYYRNNSFVICPKVNKK